LKAIIILMIVLFTAIGCSQATEMRLHSYSYTSPSAKKLLKKYNITEKEIEDYANKETKIRSIQAINGSAVYEDSKDALRIDLRSKNNKIYIELSVRQGVSIYNMLERWSKKKTIIIKTTNTDEELKQEILQLITLLIEDLKSNYNSSKYKKGTLMMD
jgi:flagellar basal body-associated protein FliL